MPASPLPCKPRSHGSCGVGDTHMSPYDLSTHPVWPARVWPAGPGGRNQYGPAARERRPFVAGDRVRGVPRVRTAIRLGEPKTVVTPAPTERNRPVMARRSETTRVLLRPQNAANKSKRSDKSKGAGLSDGPRGRWMDASMPRPPRAEEADALRHAAADVLKSPAPWYSLKPQQQNSRGISRRTLSPQLHSGGT